jgi:hypothetical protein
MYSQLPNRTSADTNASADVNTLQDNIEALKGGTGSVAPTTTIEDLSTDKLAISSLDDTPADDSETAVTSKHIYDNFGTEGLLTSVERQAIINGSFDIWQRGTTFTGLSGTNNYTSDRWNYVEAASMVASIDRSTTTPDENTNYSLKLDCTTADASIEAGELAFIGQTIEGYDWLPLYKQSFSLRFWVRSNKTGTYCVAFRNSGSDRSYVAEYTISASDAWEEKEINVTATPSGGTWDFTNGSGIQLVFTLSAGTNFHTTAGAWQTGNFIGTSNQVNFFDNTANEIYFSNVQINKGATALPYMRQSIRKTLEDCQRYYEKSYNTDVDPGTVSNPGLEQIRLTGVTVDASLFLTVKYRTTKRAAPTTTIYSPSSGTSGNGSDGGSTDRTMTSSLQGDSGFRIDYTDATPATGNLISWHWTADAEL